MTNWKQIRYSRLVLSVFTGATAGSALVIVQAITEIGKTAVLANFPYYFVLLAGIFIAIWFIWVVAILVVGIPIWALLTELKLTHWSLAAVLGYVLIFAGLLLWGEILSTSLYFALAGILVGIVVWRTYYSIPILKWLFRD